VEASGTHPAINEITRKRQWLAVIKKISRQVRESIKRQSLFPEQAVKLNNKNVAKKK
jgi:hypothetical protein